MLDKLWILNYTVKILICGHFIPSFSQYGDSHKFTSTTNNGYFNKNKKKNPISSTQFQWTGLFFSNHKHFTLAKNTWFYRSIFIQTVQKTLICPHGESQQKHVNGKTKKIQRQTGQYLSGGASPSSDGTSCGSASLSLEDFDLALPRDPGLFLSFSASFSDWR